MKIVDNKWVYIAWGISWLAVALGISVAIYITKNTACLWFFLIPAFISIKTSE